MPMTDTDVIESAMDLMKLRDAASGRLGVIAEYLRDDPNERSLGGLPPGAPADVVRLAKLSRVNLLKYVVAARVQSMYVDGFQTPESADNLAAWDIWQRNRFDARQIGVHRAALAYGASYVTVLPGTGGIPVMRGASPRTLTAGYSSDDDDWPAVALIRRPGGWRLIDTTTVYDLATDDTSDQLTVTATAEHGATFDGEPVCPVVRYRDTDDLDDPVRGIVEPLMPLQDQINITSFGLQVAQHYGAFRQRYIIGWLAESEQKALNMGAAKLMMFEDNPADIKVGEFSQTDLRGYIESREASIRHLATISQTPVHELLGEMVNLSAEALEAARASHHAAVDENRTMIGESHEQVLNLAAEMAGGQPDASGSVIWRDTRIRSLSEAAAALGQLVTGLGVPPRALWQRVPGVPQHELQQWEAQAGQGDALADLTALLDRQAQPATPATG